MSLNTAHVILVTGANRGIGLAIVQAMAADKSLCNSAFLLGNRDVAKGEEAISQLRSVGISSPLHPLPLDVTSDTSIREAASIVADRYGRLDILVNNAGYAAIPSAPDFSDYRQIYGGIYNVNVISVALTMQLFLPLLRKSVHGGKIINVSSARGSVSRSASGQQPPTVSIAYSISKTALNALTVEMSRQEENQHVEFQLVSPGHCKTAFNGYRAHDIPSKAQTWSLSWRWRRKEGINMPDSGKPMVAAATWQRYPGDICQMPVAMSLYCRWWD